MADPTTNPTTALAAVRVQVIQHPVGEIPMAKNATGLSLFNTLRAQYLPITALDLARLTVEGPTQVTGTLTKVKYTPQDHSIYRQPLEMTYHRYPISVLTGLNITPPAGGFASVSEFLAAVRTLGYLVQDSDIDLVKSVTRADGSVTLFPSKTSWLFSPDGSYDSSTLPAMEGVLPNLTTQDFDHTPHLHQAITVGELSGFEIVQPLVLGDEIGIDTLSGFSPVGGS